MDKRKFNGGNSTKAKEGKIDKRKNPYKEVLAKACTPEDIISIIQTARDKAINESDMQAAKLVLEYYLVKAESVIKVEGDGLSISVKELLEFDNLKRKI